MYGILTNIFYNSFPVKIFHYLIILPRNVIALRHKFFFVMKNILIFTLLLTVSCNKFNPEFLNNFNPVISSISDVIQELFKDEKNYDIVICGKGNMININQSKKIDFFNQISIKNEFVLHDNQECFSTLFSYDMNIMYSQPEPYTNYEKMILPFDSDTWIYFILFFCFAFVGISLINLMPKTFKNLVYGKGVKMPTFNAIGTFFGIGQTKLPDNNFARIILMHFIIFCLIFRTAYQGETFPQNNFSVKFLSFYVAKISYEIDKNLSKFE